MHAVQIFLVLWRNSWEFVFKGTQKQNWAVWIFFLPYHVGQIIKAERNFTCAQNFGHSGKTLMLKKIPVFFFFFFSSHWMPDKISGRLGILILPNNFGYKGGKVPFLPKFSCKMERWLKFFYASQKLKAISKKTLTKMFPRCLKVLGRLGKFYSGCPTISPNISNHSRCPLTWKRDYIAENNIWSSWEHEGVIF